MGWTKVILLTVQSSKTFRFFDIIWCCYLMQIFSYVWWFFWILIYILELQQFESCNKSFSFMLIVSPINLWCNSGSIFELILYITLLNVKALKRVRGVHPVTSNVEIGLRHQRSGQLLLAMCCAVTYRLEIPVHGTAASPQCLSLVSTNKRSEQEKMTTLVQGRFVLWPCVIKYVIKHLINYLYFSF